MAIGLLMLLLLFLVLAGFVTGLALWLSAKPDASAGRTSGGAAGGMSCGSCGYLVKGLGGWACPECGADLREAGMRPQSSPGRRRAGITLTRGLRIAAGAGLSVDRDTVDVDGCSYFGRPHHTAGTTQQAAILTRTGPAQHQHWRIRN